MTSTDDYLNGLTLHIQKQEEMEQHLQHREDQQKKERNDILAELKNVEFLLSQEKLRYVNKQAIIGNLKRDTMFQENIQQYLEEIGIRVAGILDLPSKSPFATTDDLFLNSDDFDSSATTTILAGQPDLSDIDMMIAMGITVDALDQQSKALFSMNENNLDDTIQRVKDKTDQTGIEINSLRNAHREYALKIKNQTESVLGFQKKIAKGNEEIKSLDVDLQNLIHSINIATNGYDEEENYDGYHNHNDFPDFDYSTHSQISLEKLNIENERLKTKVHETQKLVVKLEAALRKERCG
jgi:hypothetical protein